MLARSLPNVVDWPDDLAARNSALAGTRLAGGFRGGSCLDHRTAQRLRTLCGLTHAIGLPYVTAFNAPAAMALIDDAYFCRRPVV
jgi:alcohol dehydrogenase class IV